MDAEAAEPKAGWSLGHRVATRFWAIYLPLALNQDTTPVDWLLDPIRGFVAMRFWGLAELPENVNTGSGDRLYDVISLFAILLLALAIAGVWSVLARKRKDERWTYEIVRVLVRYAVATILMSYGFGKLGQFPPLRYAQMVAPYGAEPPMGVLWRFMETSPAYTIFTGVLEVLGGTLMLFRRTTTMGALLVAPVMANVFLLNVCYDIPVKIFSLHLLVAAAFLALPDARRLFEMLVLNRPTVPRELTPPIRFPKLRIAVLVVKWIFFAGVIRDGVDVASEELRMNRRSVPPLAGIWKVEGFRQSGNEVREVSLDHPVRWEMLTVDLSRGGSLALSVTPIGGRRRYGSIPSVKAGRLTIALKGAESSSWEWSLVANRLRLKGTMGGVPNEIELRRATEEFPLANHRTHLIQERPRSR